MKYEQSKDELMVYIEACKDMLVASGIDRHPFLAVMIQHAIERMGVVNLRGLWRTKGGFYVKIVSFDEPTKIWRGVAFTQEHEVAGDMYFDVFGNDVNGDPKAQLIERRRGEERGWPNV